MLMSNVLMYDGFYKGLKHLPTIISHRHGCQPCYHVILDKLGILYIEITP